MIKKSITHLFFEDFVYCFSKAVKNKVKKAIEKTIGGISSKRLHRR